jgi:cell division protein FtsL
VKKRNIILGLVLLLILSMVLIFILKYLDLNKEVSNLNEDISQNESEIERQELLLQERLNSINDYISKVEDYEDEINGYINKENDYKDHINKLLESSKLLEGSEHYFRHLDLFGITSEMILQDLSSHPELIPFEGVLGGTMRWVVSESYLLTDRYVFALFSDGHYTGNALLSFDIINDKIKWTLHDADVMNDDLTGRISLGKRVYSDLNGDGNYESIYYGLDDITIGLESYKHKIENDIYYNNPHKEKYILVDIDVNDNKKEIGLMVEGPSNDYMTHFYSYDGVNLLELGSVPFLVDNLKEQLDEDGNIYGKMRLQILQTWFAESRWRLVDNKLVHMPENFFDVSSDQIHNLLVELPLYRNIGDENIYTIMAPQQVKFLLTDNKNWCKLKGEDGSEGWFKIEEFNYLPDLNRYSQEVFDNLSFAD